ncbi:hypothetical protein AtubIFM55763_011644 [Aspergillus tubingensis]|nr:hypothetical protein AtubIFM55763_011644 [Aspergillus tubingensis]
MAAHDIPERYGVHPVRVARGRLIRFADKPPLTEGQIRENQANERNSQLQEEYNHLCRRLVNALDDKIFLTDSLGFIASLVTGGALPIPCRGPNNQYEEVDGDLSLPEKNSIMRIRLADVLLTLSADTQTLNTLNKVLLSRSCEHSVRPEPNTPGIFYRSIRSSSYSRYDKHLGFRSSRQPFTLPSNHHGPLHESSLVDKDVLKNQCVGGGPSDLIAMSDSPARVLRFIKHWDFRDLEGEMIAVIDVSKLLAMRVLFSRTTTLCTKLGIDAWAPSRSNGLSWVNPNYWVAYRWVPAECIEFCVSVEFLRSACKEHSIGE